LRHVPFEENHVLLIVIKSARPGCIHTPLNDSEIEQGDDERPRIDSCGKKTIELSLTCRHLPSHIVKTEIENRFFLFLFHLNAQRR
jgi:hypothetical protein